MNDENVSLRVLIRHDFPERSFFFHMQAPLLCIHYTSNLSDVLCDFDLLKSREQINMLEIAFRIEV